MHASETLRAWLAIAVVLLGCVVAVWWLRSGLSQRVARWMASFLSGRCFCGDRIRGRWRLRGKCEMGWLLAQQDSDDPHVHCWHETGYGAGHESGGSENRRCCVCNEVRTFTYRIERRPIPGHGPYVWEEVREFDELAVAYGTDVDFYPIPSIEGWRTLDPWAELER